MKPDNVESAVDIEEIMQVIRQQVLKRKELAHPAGNVNLSISGTSLPPDFYEHLYQAGLGYDQIGVSIRVAKNRTVLIGPIIDWMRRKFHELVVYYVNQLASEQIRFNIHLLQAVNILAQDRENAAGSHKSAKS